MDSKEIVVDIRNVEIQAKRLFDHGATAMLIDQSHKTDKELTGFRTISVSSSDTDKDSGDAIWIDIKEAKDVQRAIEAGKLKKYIIVRCNNWKIIPLENLIAGLHNTDAKLLASVDNLDEAKLAFEVLERGVDGIVVPPSLIDKMDMRNLTKGERLELVSAEIDSVSDIGLGERVCVDTTSILKDTEGMLVGSKSDFFYFVHSETLQSPYIAPRPFRVNAGAVHSYTLTGEDKTSYLCELRAGSHVKIVSLDGSSREVAVGRAKIERRPLILINASVSGKNGGIVLQKAETVRLIDDKRKPIPVTELKPKDRVLVHISSKTGRHFGTSIDEFIEEL
ncbi:MAG: 3-dehydroquinate synthase II [Conexivisphaerales archaeon]